MGKLLEQRNRALDDINAGRTVKKIRDLESRVRELEEENARLKDNHEAACVIIADMHAAAIGEVTGPKLGVVKDVADVRAQLAASQAYAEQLRKALGKFRDDVLFRIGSSSPYRNVAKEYFEYIRPILSLPTDTSALDAYVAEKVKISRDIDEKQIAYLFEERSLLTRQRDNLLAQVNLAVTALESIAGRRMFIDNLASNVDIAVMTLDAIKESEEN